MGWGGLKHGLFRELGGAHIINKKLSNYKLQENKFFIDMYNLLCIFNTKIR